MRSFPAACEKCGSTHLRRSRWHSMADFAYIARGQYPVRCADCNHRFITNLLQFRKLPFAKCPKCFNLDLETSPQRGYRPTMWRSFMLALGANKYRCPACRYNFLSFRFLDPEVGAPAVPDGTEGATKAVQPEA